MARLSGVTLANGQFTLEGYPDGATAHGIEGSNAKELRRLSVFLAELRRAHDWLERIPPEIAPDDPELTVYEALADAALLAFCKCFDLNSVVPPLKPKKILPPGQRDGVERLRTIRNKLVAHDEQLVRGVYSLIVQDKDKVALEAVSMQLAVSFVGLGELQLLRSLTNTCLKWVEEQHEKAATEIVKTHNALPHEVRGSAQTFTINVRTEDVFSPSKKT